MVSDEDWYTSYFENSAGIDLSIYLSIYIHTHAHTHCNLGVLSVHLINNEL